MRKRDHQAHDFNGAAGAGVHNHLEKSYGRDADSFEVVRIIFPWPLLVECSVHGG